MDGENHFLGPPDRERFANAKKTFLRLRDGEKVLYFFDWSVWGNGKTGFAITSKRVQWKCLWEDPVRFRLAKLRPDTTEPENA